MNLGRPIEFDPDAALDAAMETFWQHGYEATYLSDLLAATGLSKSSLYQTFGNKQSLFEACLVRYREIQVKQMLSALAKAKSAMAFLEALLLGIAQEARCREPSKGCLIINTATELSGREPSIAQLVSQGIEAFGSVMRAAIERGQADGDIPADRDVESLSQYLLASIAGLRAMVKAGANEKAVRQIVGVVLTALR